MELTKRIRKNPPLLLKSPPAVRAKLAAPIDTDRFEAGRVDKEQSFSWLNAARAASLFGLSLLGASCASHSPPIQQEYQAPQVGRGRKEAELRHPNTRTTTWSPRSSSSKTPSVKKKNSSVRSSQMSVRSDATVGIRVDENITVRDSNVEVKVNEKISVSSDGRVIQSLDNGMSFDSEGNVYFDF